MGSRPSLTLIDQRGRPKQQFHKRVLILFPVITLLSLGLACNASGSGDTGPVSEPEVGPETDVLALDDALEGTLTDRRPAAIEELGVPDAFVITFEDLEGVPVRSEQWSYLDFGTRYDFLDGELLWTVELESVPDASIYAHFYDPLEFSADMSTVDIEELLSGQQLETFDLGEGELPGASILAGDQILLGFDNDRLVYVETFILSPTEGS